MSRSFSVDAIVLATYNVGEADRFCILFTRDRGRIAARASAARRPGSKLGGALLPFQRVQVEIREWNNGYAITGARQQANAISAATLPRFLMASEIIELLLILLEEGESAPELFDCVVEGLQGNVSSPLPYTLRILHLLGHMPSTDMPHFAAFSMPEKSCIACWIEGNCQEASVLSMGTERALVSLCETLLSNHTSRKQRVPGIHRMMTMLA